MSSEGSGRMWPWILGVGVVGVGVAALARPRARSAAERAHDEAAAELARRADVAREAAQREAAAAKEAADAAASPAAPVDPHAADAPAQSEAEARILASSSFSMTREQWAALPEAEQRAKAVAFLADRMGRERVEASADVATWPAGSILAKLAQLFFRPSGGLDTWRPRWPAAPSGGASSGAVASGRSHPMLRAAGRP